MRGMARAKICGLRTPEAVRAAVDGGAGWIGFVTFPRSPRHIAPAAARPLAAPARGRGVEVVSVLVDPTTACWKRWRATSPPDWVQLHGSETPERVAAVRARTGLRVIKALPVSEPADLRAADAYAAADDALMFDARPPADAGRPGGVGARFDWRCSRASRRRGAPSWPAGSTPGTWRRRSTPRGWSGWTSPLAWSAGRGVKDPALISAFLEAVRRA